MPRLFRRHVVLPTDHGTWSFLLSPLIIGLFAGGTWRVATTYLVVAALCAFLVRQPITRVIKAWSGRTSGADLGAALAWTGIYTALGLLHVLGLVLRGEAYVLWLAVPGAPVFAWYLWLVWHKAERRRVLVEVVGAGALALSAPAAVWVAGGGTTPIGWALFALAWGHTACMIVIAYLRLRQRSWPSVPPPGVRLRAGRAALGLAAAELLVLIAGCAARILPGSLFAPFLLQLGFALDEVLRPAVGWRPRSIGLRLLGATAIFTALFVWTWGSGPAAS